MRHIALTAVLAAFSGVSMVQADAWTMLDGAMNYDSDMGGSTYNQYIYMLDYPGGYDTGSGSYDHTGPGIDMWAASSESSTSESDSYGGGYEDYWYESTDFGLQISTDTGLVISGWGDMGYRFRNIATGADFQGATGTLSQFTLGAGVWSISFADMGYGEGYTNEDYWESEDGSEWYYSYSYSYSANGGMSIDVGVPAPGAIALLGLAGLCTRRRRRG